MHIRKYKLIPLKSWIVQHAVKGFLVKGKKAIANIGLTPKKFVSAVFDDILDKEVTADFKDRAGLALWEIQPNGMKMYSSSDCYLIYKQNTLFPLMVYMVDLFEVTTRRQSLLCSNSINKRSIRGLDNRIKSVNAKPISDACGVLGVSLADTIGCVPKLHTIDQVLYLKETKAKQIEGLNDALTELSVCIQEGRQQGLQKAKELISLATDDLNHGLQVTKVGNWVTYASLPVGIIELLIGMPPIIGIGLSSVGAGGAVYEHLTKQKRWFSLFR